MTDMNFSVEAYLNSLFDSTPQKYAFNGTREWTRAARGRLVETIGVFDKPEASAYQTIETRRYSGYTLEKIAFNVTDGLACPAYLLTPEKPLPNNPAVVALHGHGYGARDICALKPDGTDKAEDEDAGYEINFAVMLARLGFVVLAPEIIGFGDMRFDSDKNAPDNSSCQRLAAHLTMLGKTLMGLRVSQISRCADVLSSISTVGKIGIMGISGGGMVTAFTVAVDERFAAAVICGYTNTFRGCILAMHHCVCNYVHGIWNGFDQPDVISLIAPRPLFVEAGVNDPIFPIAAVKQALEKIQKVYDVYGASGELEHEFCEGGHQVFARNSPDFLKRKLS